MTNSFFQTRVHPDDIHLTAVRTPFGLYEWTVMPMGGTNAPATHQRRMNDALREHIGTICHVYLDDIIIWSQTVEEHEQNVAKMMDALRAAHLFCNPKKTELFCTEVSFLGHILRADGIYADPRKTDRIVNWPVPKSATEVRQFLGLVRYISQFLPALAEHTSHLTPLTNKECDKVFPAWTDDHQHAFQAIKDIVISRDCLTTIDYADPTKKIFLTTDASDRRTGAVLSFGETWETARPVAFDSIQLKGAEKNYPVHEKELLAILKSLKHWRYLLLGAHFEVFTDHRTLEYFETWPEEPSRRQSRWQEYMSQYDFDIHYFKGEDNTVADGMSRMPDEDSPAPICAVFALANLSSESPVSSADSTATSTFTITADTTLLHNIQAGYASDDFCQKLIKNLSSIEGARLDPETKLLYVGRRLLIPRDTSIRETLFRLAHDSLGHAGFDKAYASLRDDYYWPNMRRDLEGAYIPSCTDCQRNKSRTSKPPGPLHPLPVPDQRFQSVAIDFIGPLPKDKGYDSIITMTDRAGADIQIVPSETTLTAERFAVIFFNEWYCENGLPIEIISDRDKLFMTKFWHALHKLTGVKVKMSTAYHPETDGASERSNKTVNEAIRSHVDANQTGWVAVLPRIRFAIMNTVNASTGYSPFQLKSVHSPRLIPPFVPSNRTKEDRDAGAVMQQIELDVKDAQDNLLAAKIRQAYHANEHRAAEDVFEKGDRVMLSTENRQREYKRKGAKRVAKFMPRWDGPYIVIEAFPEKSQYTLQLPNSPRTFPGFHASLLKRHKANDPTLFPGRELSGPRPIVTADGWEEWPIDRIVDERRRGRGKQYKVRWLGEGPEEERWVSGAEMAQTEALDVWEAKEAERIREQSG